MKTEMKSLTYNIFACVVILACVGFANAQGTINNYTVLDQPVNDLVYSATRRILYASVPSTGGPFGNFIIAIDPSTKQVIGSVFVGSEPNEIAMSDDESVLYVGLDGSAAIRRVRLDSLSADLLFTLGSGSNGPYFAEDIVVLPGEPGAIAVSRRNSCCSPRHEGVAIYDDGVKRATNTASHTGSNAIEPGAGSGVLYGYNNETSDFGFRRMSVGTSGVSITSNLQNAIQGYYVDIKYGDGMIYATSGKVIDPVNNLLYATLAIQGFADGVEVDPKYKRVYFIDDNSLKVFNTSYFQPTGTDTLGVSGYSNRARLTRWGRRGLAYRASDSRLVVFETSLIPVRPDSVFAVAPPVF
jgi:DNA-binding beta-propeller fold protein YncE